VLNLFGRDACFETNCSNCPEPDLRGFESGYHRVILFDEATCELVLRNKKLFQAPASFVQLGCSTTNCHTYEHWLNQIALVITSNTWPMEKLLLRSDADREWLDANSVVLHVRENMYE